MFELAASAPINEFSNKSNLNPQINTPDVSKQKSNDEIYNDIHQEESIASKISI